MKNVQFAALLLKVHFQVFWSRPTLQVVQQNPVPDSQHANSLQSQPEPSFTDTNDPVKYIGKKLTDDQKVSLLTSSSDIPLTYPFPVSNGI